MWTSNVLTELKNSKIVIANTNINYVIRLKYFYNNKLLYMGNVLL